MGALDPLRPPRLRGARLLRPSGAAPYRPSGLDAVRGGHLLHHLCPVAQYRGLGVLRCGGAIPGLQLAGADAVRDRPPHRLLLLHLRPRHPGPDRADPARRSHDDPPLCRCGPVGADQPRAGHPRRHRTLCLRQLQGFPAPQDRQFPAAVPPSGRRAATAHRRAAGDRSRRRHHLFRAAAGAQSRLRHRAGDLRRVLLAGARLARAGRSRRVGGHLPDRPFGRSRDRRSRRPPRVPHPLPAHTLRGRHRDGAGLRAKRDAPAAAGGAGSGAPPR